MLEENDPKFPLPPCRVCNAPGAGFHYGVNTCEACKGFFHRSLNHCSRYKCVNKGNCTIQHGKGKMCRLCRYQKCLDMGMSKSAIKTGRYNYKKKTDDILEVKQMVKELSRDTKNDLANQLNYFSPGTVTPPSDSGSQDSLRDRVHEGPLIPKSKSCSPVPSSGEIRGQDSNSGHQNTTDFGINQNKSHSGYNSATTYSGSYSVSPDSSSQWTRDSLMSPSSPNTQTETSRPSSPSLSMSSSLSPYLEKSQHHSFENIPFQSQFQSQSDSPPSSQNFSNDFPASPKPVPLINTFEMLTIEPVTSLGNDSLSSDSGPSGARTKCGVDNEVSSSCETLNIQAMYRNKDEVVQSLVEAHQTYVTQHFKDIPKEELERQQRDHYEACVLRKEIFGHIRRLPDHEYEQLYGATGIDADNRAKRMSDYAQGMEETIQLMVCFAMAIPGFAELPKKAKLHLIKFSRQEFSLLNLIKYVNLELKVYRGVENDWQCSLEMENSKYRVILDSVFMFLGKFQALNMTIEESVVMNALVVMAPDRESEVCSKAALAIYDQLVELLIYLLVKRFDKPMLVFAKLMGLMTECRTKVEEMSTGFKDYNLIRYMPINDKPLIQLMYAGIYF